MQLSPDEINKIQAIQREIPNGIYKTTLMHHYFLFFPFILFMMRVHFDEIGKPPAIQYFIVGSYRSEKMQFRVRQWTSLSADMSQIKRVQINPIIIVKFDNVFVGCSFVIAINRINGWIFVDAFRRKSISMSLIWMLSKCAFSFTPGDYFNDKIGTPNSAFRSHVVTRV